MDLLKGVVKNRTLMNFDGFLYILGIPMMLITFLLLAVNSVIFATGGMTGMELLYNYGKYLFATFLLPIVTALIILILDRRPVKPMIKGLLAYPLFLGSWILINLKCLVKPNVKWEKINHVRDIKIDEVV